MELVPPGPMQPTAWWWTVVREIWLRAVWKAGADGVCTRFHRPPPRQT